ncbi:MutS domain V protein [Teladorsagia circumcincta]|uniref:MutS domain V protein n=1 Tax=Teladorsagia circumcincta TaxID=45464 RepID=A0A2G9V2U5_TELCI|nr:MutS domain V protein [Teladorsagia circumcincta]
METADKSLLRCLNSKAAGTVAIFDKGDYYACYGDDAVLLATEIFMSDVCLKTVSIKGEVLQYLTMSHGQYQRTVRELLMFMRYRIELYGLESDQWAVKAKGTIGNLGDFEEIIGEAVGGGNVIMAIKIANGENNKVSVTFMDMLDFRVLTSEFIDSPLFAQVEHCIVGIGPRECLVYTDEGDCPFTGKERPKKLNALLRKVGVLETNAAQITSTADWEEVQNIFRPGCEVTSLSDNLKRCLCGLFTYLKMDEQEAYTHKFTLSTYRTSGFMHIDAGAVRALELFALNYHQGEWLARPLCELRQITERQDVIESLVINSDEEKNLRSCKFITIFDTTKGGGVRFKDDDLVEINERGLSSALATIDVVTSLARLAADSAGEYVRPKLEPMGSGVFELRKCRHPVLEALIDEHFIPNDIDLGSNRMVVLTGANMGGKSTYLRSAAISALLAQIGSFVPATYARLSVLDGIFTRVGASDQQTRGISTFMAEMLDSATILETATSNSLVIVDELGRGTSTYDGFGLAWAIANDLLNRVRCFCLFATHFHEMGALAKQPGATAMQHVVLQMSVAVQDGQLTMLYEVRPGVAQSSFGIHVSRTVGFPEHIVEEASRILEELENPASESDIDALIEKFKTADDTQLMQLLV